MKTKVVSADAVGFGYHTPSALWLAGAIKWREEARHAKTGGGRAMARRYMRQSAQCWRRRAAVGL